MRINWTAIYPNPDEISRSKYYEFKIENSTAIVFGDNDIFEYTVEQLKEFFTLETGTWDEVFKETKKKKED